jgi:hypothetical protein
MKQICKISLFLAVKSFSALLLFAFAIYILRGLIFIPKFNPKKEHGPQHSAASATPDEGIRENIASREYHITYDSTKHCLQSPNRRHNLRAFYEPGKLTVKGRAHSSDSQFKFELVTKAIYADGRILHLPSLQAEKRINGNTLHIDHGGFKEEFINNDAGIRQNFIIENAPSDIQHLQVSLAANGFQVKEDTDKSIHFEAKNPHTHEITTLIYHDIKCWDANKRPLTARMSYQNGLIALNVDVKNAAFPVTIDPLIINGNPGNAATTLQANQSEAWFGFAVSSAGDIDGDGYSDVVVGAPHYDLGQPDEGAAFVYFGSATGLGQSATILQGNQANAQMGYAVASGGDINKDGYSDIIVGAPQYDKGQLDEGVAFVYYGSQKGLNVIPSAILEQNQANARFGISVALAGDVNADGHSDLLVGADHYDSGQINEGAAFLYYGSAGGININNAATFESNQVDAMLGSAVASAGDLNADGFSDVMAGARFYDKGEADEGVVFIYKGSLAGVSPANPLILESNQADARMGNALAPAGDLNGDSYGDIAVGAYHFDNGQSNEGAVFIYHGSAVGAALSLTLEGQQMEAQMGVSVASAGDTDGDGYADLLVGIRNQGKGQANEGFALVYRGSATGIKVQPSAKFQSNQADAFLGSSCASAGDVNGDGFSDIIVGAYLYDDNQSNEGAAFVWHGSATGLDGAATTPLDNNQQMSGFGYSVSDAGDVNGDGFGDIVVGAPNFDNGENEEGAAFIYLGTLGGISKSAPVMLEANQADAGFGTSVSGAGDVNADGYSDVVIGAIRYDNGEIDEGAAFVYHGSPLGISPVPAAIFDSNLAGAWMGCAVAGAGDINADGYGDIIVGAVNFSNGQSEEGKFHVFPGSSSGSVTAGSFSMESDLADARMGNSVAAAGDVNGDGFADVVVGAFGFEDDDRGAVFIYQGSAFGLNVNNVTSIKGTQPYAQFGWDVSGAGDVNGDGFGDIVIGANAYDNGDGAAFVYHGSATGISQVSSANLYTHQPGMTGSMGQSVSAAGDVDGDGYSDIVVGVPWYIDENTSILIGQALIFQGSPSGINTSPEALNGNKTDVYDFFGWSVAGAGDIDGDGYGDVLVGSPNFSSSQTDADAAHIYYGNGGNGMRNNLTLYNSDLTTIINHSQKTKGDFGAGFYCGSFLGKNKGKLVWEVVENGHSFSSGASGDMTHSTQFTGSQKAFGSLLATGTELKNIVPKAGLSTRLRVRVRYDPSLALTGQTYGVWRYLPYQMLGTNIAPAPTQMEAEVMPAFNDSLKYKSRVATYPNPTSQKLLIRTPETTTISSIRLLANTGKQISMYPGKTREIDVSNLTQGIYMLVISHPDHSETIHRIMIE